MPDGLVERLAEAPLVCDGAMGTMLYGKGVYINRCYDEVNLTQPELVGEIHRAYVKAGSEAIETNSFGANPTKLGRHGLDDRTEEINRRAAQRCRQDPGERDSLDDATAPSSVRTSSPVHRAGASGRSFDRPRPRWPVVSAD